MNVGGQLVRGHAQVRPFARCRCGWESSTRPTSDRQGRAIYNEHRQEMVAARLTKCRECGQALNDENAAVRVPGLCKDCLTKRVKVWSAAHSDLTIRQKRASHLKRNYGISIEEFEAIADKQDHCCAICRRPFLGGDVRGFAPHVDHDHESGIVRGILCGQCNRGLGHFGDDPSLLASAVAYLERAK